MRVKTPEGVGVVIESNLYQIKVDIQEGNAHFIKVWDRGDCEILKEEE